MTRPIGRLGLAGALLATVMIVVSCGRYFSAEIAGYVKDSDSGAGIDGAIIRIYLNEPDSADAAGFIVETASVTSAGNPGYFNHEIIWQNLFPAFGAEGDTNSVWLGITHEDYLQAAVQVRGILSGTVNFIPDVLLDRAEFSTPLVRGGVIGPSGDGLNGVRVVLDIASTDETEDYVTVTTTVGGDDGTYEFSDVSWRDDQAAGGGSDTEDATVLVDDDEYGSTQELSIVLSSGREKEITEYLVVSRSDPTSFATTLTGRCLNRYGSAPDLQEVPAQGIEVTCAYVDDDGPHTLYDQTDPDGSYSFFIRWTDADYGDFLDGSADSTIPAGEDGLIVEITFAAPFAALSFVGASPGSYELPAGSTTDDRQVKSWLDPNYAPDAVNVN